MYKKYRKIISLLVFTILITAIALPVSAGMFDIFSGNNPFKTINENSNPNLTSNSMNILENEYNSYMRTFSSNILLLGIILISGLIIAISVIAGNKIFGTYYYLEKLSLRVILIPLYSIFGIILIVLSLIATAYSGSSIDNNSSYLSAFILALILFLYATSSFSLAYSIIRKKVYAGLIILEFVMPYVTMIDLYLTESAVFIENPEIRTMVYIPLSILLSIPPIIHSLTIKKRTVIQKEQSKNTDTLFGISTLPYDEDGEVIHQQATKQNRLPNELSERYINAEYICKGGTARIYKARRRDDGRVAAVKIPINFDERTGRSFLKEMNLWKELDHKNIVKVYSVNILPIPYVEMEFCELSLAEIKKPLETDKAVEYILEVAEGLQYAHERGVLHRDIKPQNILLRSKDGKYIPKITDWGLGKLISDKSETKTLAFSLNYAAPEQVAPGIFGHCDGRTDLFQLGVVFYELITGVLPFTGEGVGEYSASIISKEPKLPSYINPKAKAYDKIIMKCLMKYPEERYDSIAELISDINRTKE